MEPCPNCDGDGLCPGCGGDGVQCPSFGNCGECQDCQDGDGVCTMCEGDGEVSAGSLD